jgi:hypothetical protein
MVVGAHHDVDEAELVPLTVQETHAQRGEADEAGHRSRHCLIDTGQVQRRAGERGDLVDNFQAARALVELPRLRHREAELFRKAQGDAVGVQAAAAAGAEQDEATRRRRGLPEACAEQAGPRAAAPARRGLA